MAALPKQTMGGGGRTPTWVIAKYALFLDAFDILTTSGDSTGATAYDAEERMLTTCKVLSKGTELMSLGSASVEAAAQQIAELNPFNWGYGDECSVMILPSEVLMYPSVVYRCKDAGQAPTSAAGSVLFSLANPDSPLVRGTTTFMADGKKCDFVMRYNMPYGAIVPPAAGLILLRSIKDFWSVYTDVHWFVNFKAGTKIPENEEMFHMVSQSMLPQKMVFQSRDYMTLSQFAAYQKDASVELAFVAIVTHPLIQMSALCSSIESRGKQEGLSAIKTCGDAASFIVANKAELSSSLELRHALHNALVDEKIPILDVLSELILFTEGDTDLTMIHCLVNVGMLECVKF